ncbi:MAG: tRNA-dihydrouridine synthase, partial [Pseudomonadota bacterium]|nr:tRNA-dihydrouridine synthase [Pseudomonadota bacterium]
LAQSGAAGVMIGRGAQDRPWLIDQTVDHLAGRRPRKAPDAATRSAQLCALIDRMLSYHGTAHGLRQVRKHVSSALVGIDKAAAYRKAANTTDDPAQMVAVIHAFFIEAGAVEGDGITAPEAPALAIAA